MVGCVVMLFIDVFGVVVECVVGIYEYYDGSIVVVGGCKVVECFYCVIGLCLIGGCVELIVDYYYCW